MKKIIALLLSVIITISMVACGEAEPVKSKFLGTWNAVSLEAEGVSFTVDELKALGEDEFADFTIVVKDGGKAYVYVDGDSDLLDWEETEEGIKIGDASCTFTEEQLCLENDGYKIFFIKTSDSQTIEVISTPETTPETVDDEEVSDIDKSNENSLEEGIRPEFKEAMDTYEAFFREYVDFMKRYMDAEADEMIGMLADYTDYLTKYAEAMEEFEALEDNEMSFEESMYYIDVTYRIADMLWEIEY